MMTSSNGNIFRVIGPLWGKTTVQRWFPLTKTFDTELCWFLWSTPEHTFEQIIKTPVIWNAIALIMTSLFYVIGGWVVSQRLRCIIKLFFHFINYMVESCWCTVISRAPPVRVWIVTNTTISRNGIYRQISNINRTKSQTLTVSCLVLYLSMLNPLKPSITLRMKM